MLCLKHGVAPSFLFSSLEFQMNIVSSINEDTLPYLFLIFSIFISLIFKAFHPPAEESRAQQAEVEIFKQKWTRRIATASLALNMSQTMLSASNLRTPWLICWLICSILSLVTYANPPALASLTPFYLYSFYMHGVDALDGDKVSPIIITIFSLLLVVLECSAVYVKQYTEPFASQSSRPSFPESTSSLVSRLLFSYMTPMVNQGILLLTERKPKRFKCSGYVGLGCSL